MAEPDQDRFSKADLSPKARRIGLAASLLIRLFSLTYRWKLNDPAGLVEKAPDSSMIWLAWHNRIFTLPGAYRRFLPHRRGAVLTSPSKDGEIIAAAMERFGAAAVRGSSSRRGAAALVEMKAWIEDGYDLAIIPDGPRGPRYRFGPGAIKLAQITGASLLPIRLESKSYWKFRSWDQFRLPKPFTTVNVFLEPLITVASDLTDEEFEHERIRLEKVLNPTHETD